MQSTKRVVIIGAGYTGLVAALRLAQNGVKVTIVEKGLTVGGLASDFTIEGAPLERAYHHLFKTDEYIIKLAAELGLESKLNWHDSSVSLYYNDTLYPFKGALDLLRFKPLRLYDRFRAGIVVLYLQKNSNWQKLQHIEAYNWMLRYAGKRVTKVVWEPLLKGKFDKYYDKVSMAWLWARIHIRAQSRETGSEKLGYFAGGFQTLTEALIKRLHQLDVEILTGIDIKHINSTDGNAEIIFADDTSQTYTACLATTPSYIFARLIADSPNIEKTYIEELNSINYLGARLLVFSSEQDISPYYWHNINDLKLPFLVFINHTKLINKKFYGGKYIYYVATYLPHDHELFICDDKKIEQLWFAGLAKIFPNFNPKLIREKYYFRFANAQHIVDTEYANKIPKLKTPLPQIYLSNFSQIYPEDRGTNYAVREGEKAAAAILEAQ